MSAQLVSEQAEALHKRAIVIDAHSDILNSVAEGICCLGERVTIPLPHEWPSLPGFRAGERATPYQLSAYAAWFGCAGQYDVPAFQQGGLTAQIVAVYVTDEHLNDPVGRAMRLISAMHREIKSNRDTLLLMKTTADILQAKAEGKTALILAFEGAEPLGYDLNLLDAYYALGLRVVGLSHSRRNLWADGAQMNTETGGLTYRGRELVHRLNELGIVIDLAHLNDMGFWEVLSLTAVPPIISHTSLLKVYPGYRAPLTEVNQARQKTKLKALAARGGVVGILFWDQPDVERVVDDIMLAIKHAGEDHVALGSDLYGRERVTVGLEDMSGLPLLTDALLRRGLSEEAVLKILGQNWLRIFREVIDART